MGNITIGITTHNRPNFLQRCLKSITKQRYEEDRIKVIIHNDSSKTKDYAAVRKWAFEHFEDLTWLNSNQVGLCEARNKIIRACETSHLCFCDDDDWFTRDHITNFYQGIAQSGSSTVIVNSTIEKHAWGSRFLHKNPPNNIESTSENVGYVIRDSNKSNTFCFPVKSAPFFNPEWGVDENFYFQIALAQKHKFLYTLEFTAVVECRHESMTTNFSHLASSKVIAFQKISELNLARDPSFQDYKNKWISAAIPYLDFKTRIAVLNAEHLSLIGCRNILRMIVSWNFKR